MNPLGPFLSSLMTELEDDYVGLWSVVKQLRRTFPDDAPEDIRHKTLALVWFLLQMGSVEAGFPTEDGREFESWHLEPDGVVSRIATEWKDPERYPTIGEIAWLTATNDS